jgi:hypothetical protein
MAQVVESGRMSAFQAQSPAFKPQSHQKKKKKKKKVGSEKVKNVLQANCFS